MIPNCSRLPGFKSSLNGVQLKIHHDLEETSFPTSGLKCTQPPRNGNCYLSSRIGPFWPKGILRQAGQTGRPLLGESTYAGISAGTRPMSQAGPARQCQERRLPSDRSGGQTVVQKLLDSGGRRSRLLRPDGSLAMAHQDFQRIVGRGSGFQGAALRSSPRACRAILARAASLAIRIVGAEYSGGAFVQPHTAESKPRSAGFPPGGSSGIATGKPSPTRTIPPVPGSLVKLAARLGL